MNTLLKIKEDQIKIGSVEIEGQADNLYIFTPCYRFTSFEINGETYDLISKNKLFTEDGFRSNFLYADEACDIILEIVRIQNFFHDKEFINKRLDKLYDSGIQNYDDAAQVVKFIKENIQIDASNFLPVTEKEQANLELKSRLQDAKSRIELTSSKL